MYCITRFAEGVGDLASNSVMSGNNEQVVVLASTEYVSQSFDLVAAASAATVSVYTSAGDSTHCCYVAGHF